MAVDEQERQRTVRAARARAARAYVNVQQGEIAQALGVSLVTIRRLEQGRKDIAMDELYAIADVCGVPRAFMDYGFETIPAQLRSIHSRFDRLEATLSMTVAQAIAGRALEILDGDDAGQDAD